MGRKKLKLVVVGFLDKFFKPDFKGIIYRLNNFSVVNLPETIRSFGENIIRVEEGDDLEIFDSEDLTKTVWQGKVEFCSVKAKWNNVLLNAFLKRNKIDKKSLKLPKYVDVPIPKGISNKDWIKFIGGRHTAKLTKK